MKSTGIDEGCWKGGGHSTFQRRSLAMLFLPLRCGWYSGIQVIQSSTMLPPHAALDRQDLAVTPEHVSSASSLQCQTEQGFFLFHRSRIFRQTKMTEYSAEAEQNRIFHILPNILSKVEYSYLLPNNNCRKLHDIGICICHFATQTPLQSSIHL